ncbi:hypothetical protein DOY81_015024, partial [Sarcophaga bullata]
AEMRGGFGAMHAAMNGYLGQHSQLGQTSGGSSTGSIGSQQQMIGSSMGNLSLSNDFMKSPLSLKSEDIDTMSQHSDDMDEDTSRPNSPQLPLSLTIHERHQPTPDLEIKDNNTDLSHKPNILDDNSSEDKAGVVNVSPSERALAYATGDKDKFSNDLNKSNDESENQENSTHEDLTQTHNETETNNNSSNSLNNNASTQDLTQNPSRPSSPKNASSKEDDEDLDMDDDDEMD